MTWLTIIARMGGKPKTKISKESCPETIEDFFSTLRTLKMEALLDCNEQTNPRNLQNLDEMEIKKGSDKRAV